eukprot:6179058-Pleurochrysis_carterae.AAC.4
MRTFWGTARTQYHVKHACVQSVTWRLCEACACGSARSGHACMSAACTNEQRAHASVEHACSEQPGMDVQCKCDALARVGMRKPASA